MPRTDWNQVKRALHLRDVKGMNVSQIARKMGKHRRQIQRYFEYAERDSLSTSSR